MNVEQRRAYNNERGRANNTHRAEYLKGWTRRNQNKTMFNSAKRNAAIKGVPFTLELSDIVIPDRCPYLGTPLTRADFASRDNSASLDRIKPELGYVPGNVEVISYRANRLKNDGTVEEIEAIAKRLRSLHGNLNL